MSINKLNFLEKNAGDTLAASEWNQTVDKIDELVEASNNGGGNGEVVSIIDDTVSDPSAGVNIATGITNVGTVKVMELTKKKKGVNTTIVSLNNINIEPRESVDDTKGGNISFKPGDDIEFCSHHRLADNQDEVSVKIIDGDDNPVKLQLNAAEITLTTKDKIGDDANVFDINVNSGKNTKGYLKVRAQAIDLRCEEHGGIALQPKGDDGSGHENKIKFEHDGGDGLEFGTFNTLKTSIFTNLYRFNKDGLVYPVTRGVPVTTYKVDNDSSSGIKKVDYPTQADDFKDILDNNKYCTWEDIVAAGQGCSVSEKGLTIKNNKNTLNSGPIAETNFGNVILYSLFYAKPLAKGTNTDELDNSINAMQNPQNVQNAKQIALGATGISLPSDTDLEATASSILDNFETNHYKTYTAKEIREKFYTYADVWYIQEQLKLAYELGKYVKFSSRGASVIFQPFYKELELSSGFINYPINHALTKQDEDIRVKVSDIAKLVTWMKNNNQGPWANS